jgi:hypothetical protein
MKRIYEDEIENLKEGDLVTVVYYDDNKIKKYEHLYEFMYVEENSLSDNKSVHLKSIMYFYINEGWDEDNISGRLYYYLDTFSRKGVYKNDYKMYYIGPKEEFPEYLI